MAALIPFTSNYLDVSTNEGYQFEFRCQRCGNGYRSGFRHSLTGFGGRLAALGGGLFGGEIGNRVQEVGYIAQWDRSSTRGTTNDKRLVEASHDVAGKFVQCRPCGEWVCTDVCWADHGGCCTRCESEGRSPVSLRHPGRPTSAGAYCSNCGNMASGAFCGTCGHSMAPAACSNCGTPSTGTPFCTTCGTPAH